MVQALRSLSGPSPAGEGGPGISLRHFSRLRALETNNSIYIAAWKNMLFLAPKWWPTIFVTRSLALREAVLKGEWGLRAPGEGCVLLCATAISKVAAAKCRPRRHQSHSTIGRKHRRHRRLRSPPMALTGRRLDSRPWTSPAKERAVALTARHYRRRLRHDRPQHRYFSR